MHALKAYAGHGAVRLLNADRAQGAMLLERLDPGSLILLEDDERATEMAAHLMQRLWRSSPGGVQFPTVQEWGNGFGRMLDAFPDAEGPIPNHLLFEAEGQFLELSVSSSARVLLHGDLHQWNILSAQRQDWLAIDPKGVLGEPAYEVGAWMRNPFPDLLDWPDLARVQSRRLDQMCEILGLDRERLQSWAFSQAVLAACWEFEEGGKQWEAWLECAKSIRRAV